MKKKKQQEIDAMTFSMLASIVGDEAANQFAKMDEKEQLIALVILGLKGMGASKDDAMAISRILRILLEKEETLTGALIYGLLKVMSEN